MSGFILQSSPNTRITFDHPSTMSNRIERNIPAGKAIIRDLRYSSGSILHRESCNLHTCRRVDSIGHRVVGQFVRFNRAGNGVTGTGEEVPERRGGDGEIESVLEYTGRQNGLVYVRTVMGKATDVNGGSFAMKLSCRIKGREVGRG